MNGQPLPNIHGGPVRLVIPGWPGSVSSKWLTRIWVRDKVHDGPGMGGTSYRVAIKPMVPGDRPDEKNFRDLESMPVRSIITSPANGTSFGKDVREVKLRGAAWAGDLTVQQRRRLDRLRRDLDSRPSSDSRRTPTTGSAGPRRVKLPTRGLLRDLDARDRLARRHAAAHRRQLESAGLRRQSDAPGGDSDRVMRSRAICVLALAALALAAAPAAAQAPAFTPRDESPEDYPAGAGREQTFYACTPCHGFKIVAQQGQSRAAVGRHPRLDDAAAQHAAAERQRPQGRCSTISRRRSPPARRADGRIRSRNERRLAMG